jgi:hypothetical protein
MIDRVNLPAVKAGAPASAQSVQGVKAQDSKEAEKPAEPKDVFQQTSPQKTKGKYRGVFAFAQAMESFTRMLGSTGTFFVVLNGILGSAPGGLAGIFGLMGGTLNIVDGAYEAKASAVNHSMAGAVTGTLSVCQGVATMAACLGAGPIAGIAAGVLALGKFGFSIWNQLRSRKASEESKHPTVEPKPPEKPEPPPEAHIAPSNLKTKPAAA